MEPVMLIIILALIGTLAITGYCYNMSSLAKMPVLTGMSLLRALGVVFFPLGCIIGFISDKK